MTLTLKQIAKLRQWQQADGGPLSVTNATMDALLSAAEENARLREALVEAEGRLKRLQEDGLADSPVTLANIAARPGSPPMSEWSVGEMAEWQHIPRGGWGIPFPVCVTIVQLKSDRAKVEAPLARGGVKLVWVKTANLRKLTHEQITRQLAGPSHE